jgi:hypothetical protein
MAAPYDYRRIGAFLPYFKADILTKSSLKSTVKQRGGRVMVVLLRLIWLRFSE